MGGTWHEVARTAWRWSEVTAGRGVGAGSCARLSATSLVTTMKLYPRGHRWCQGLAPGSQAECDTLTDFPDTPTDFRDTRRIVASPCAIRCDHGFLPTYLQCAPTTRDPLRVDLDPLMKNLGLAARPSRETIAMRVERSCPHLLG
jgi:hypothetical protein